MKKRPADDRVIPIQRNAETGSMSIEAPCRKHNITGQMFFRCNKSDGLCL